VNKLNEVFEKLRLIANPSEAMLATEARLNESFASLPLSGLAQEMLKAGLISLADSIEDLTPVETKALRERVMAKAMSSAGHKMGEESFKKKKDTVSLTTRRCPP
jgi:hypothetical protein